MADLSMQLGLRAAKGHLRYAADSSFTTDMTLNGLKVQTLDLGTATQSINTALLTTLGICFAQSLATVATHTISFGRLVGTNLYSSCTLKAGEAALLRLTAGEYAAEAAVASSRLLITITEG